MVYIKRVDLTHFKSFGGTTSIPLLPGFTVISGPNGSGKSNILDALLFCLGLATSKGMRAERLPDLVNHTYGGRRDSSEAGVSVTFHLHDQPDAPDGDWTVSRRLRVSKGGNYTSTYYIDGEPCTVGELHERLHRLRIYPEGYNVILQGDVTRIITMNPKERREIIDELAGVAEFDRKIEKTRENIGSVKEREERCQIIVGELRRSLEKLALDRVKAEKYQELKARLHECQHREAVARWRALHAKLEGARRAIAAGEAESERADTGAAELAGRVAETAREWESLNLRVKALGEEEHLTLTASLAAGQARRQQGQQRRAELRELEREHRAKIEGFLGEIEGERRELERLEREKGRLATELLPVLERECREERRALEAGREKADSLAEASATRAREQTELSRAIAGLQERLSPLQTERARWTERIELLLASIAAQEPRLARVEEEIERKSQSLQELAAELPLLAASLEEMTAKVTVIEREVLVGQETAKRLLKEQRDKQRELDRLEAAGQARQEAQGTHATQVLLQSDLPGVCGLVAGLGEVEPRFQLALEIAAGGRLGHLVVEDDGVAAAAIALLKQRRAGRATFLPLDKIRPPRAPDISSLRHARGYVDLAVNLVRCERRYLDIFAYVFGSTLVFEDLNQARPYLGRYRLVTLEGELLETSGAMTGGSQPNRSGLRFGKIAGRESWEMEALRERLTEIERLLALDDEKLQGAHRSLARLTATATETRQIYRDGHSRHQQLEKDLQRLRQERDELTRQLADNERESVAARARAEDLAREIPVLETRLQEEQQKLQRSEQDRSRGEWQEIQGAIRAREAVLQERENTRERTREQIKDLQDRARRSEEKIAGALRKIDESRASLRGGERQLEELDSEIEALARSLVETERALQELGTELQETRQARDRAEKELDSLKTRRQELIWQAEKLQSSQQERRQLVAELQERIRETEPPYPLAETPEEEIEIEKIEEETQQLQKKISALEPVNMLAMEEYEKTRERLDELGDKLTTLEAERTELLLRIENFTTLRLNAFSDAFNKVNENFKNTFSELSEGDGHLQLENEEDPFSGGLNLIAHPKGKPVQRLSSMSGGEKSLTALSFIFSLQRYRPSPFYAFDEVDMFLDGANVEKLARMIREQARQAQFIVVSLRRPMIESSERTIGVTQARGTHTQVLGIKV